MYRLFTSIWLSVFISVVLITPVKSQQPDLVFHNLTEKDGLSSNFINCFLKDSKGTLWVGTLNGLNRYDGKHFFTYKNNQDTSSLPNNTIHCLAEDKNGNIWGGTDLGVFCWIRKENKFKRFTTEKAPVPSNCFSIVCSSDGTVWAASIKGLNRIRPGSEKFEKVPIKSNGNIQLSDNSIRKNGLALSPDEQLIWLATREGLMCYIIKTQQWLDAKNNTGFTIFNGNNAAALSSTRFGHYWYYDNKEQQLIGFDPVSKKTKYTIPLKQKIQGGLGATILEDKNHILWVCNWNYETFTLDYLQSNTLKSFKHENENINSVAGDFFWSALEDADGSVWLGTVGGISICNTAKSFYKIHHLSSLVYGDKNIGIHCIAENKHDITWWISTSKPTLIHYNPITASYKEYDFKKFKPDKNGVVPWGVYRITFIKEIPLLTTPAGAWYYSNTQKNFIPFNLPAPYDTVTLKLVTNYNDTLFYFSDYLKVYAWNCKTGQVTPVPFIRNFKLDGETPQTMLLTSRPEKGVWMLNGNDYISFVNKNNQLEPVKFSSSSKEKFAFYTSIDIDNNGNIWIAKGGDGLYFYNPSTKESKSWIHEIDRVGISISDLKNNIWCASFNKFCVYYPTLNKFYNFSLPIANNNYAYENQVMRLKNGDIAISALGEIIQFFPDRMNTVSVKNQPVISMVEVNDTLLFIDGLKKLKLKPEQNNLLFKFGLLTDAETFPYEIHFILEGAEKQWQIAGKNFEANYNSLSYGNYTFKIKAFAKDGSWQSGETSLEIQIDSPFYKKWWFPYLIIILVLFAILFIYRLRTRNIRKLTDLQSKAQLLEKEKALVMYENLKQHLNPHFLFNSLTSLGSLITIDPKQAGNFLDKMSKVYRYILKNRDNETVPLSEELKFVQLYIDLQKTRFEEGLIVSMNIEEEYFHRKIAPVTLQNLVENAIKHNTADAESPLSIELFTENDYLIVRNNLQKKSFVETSNKQGLSNMESLYRYLSSRPMEIQEDEKYFTIKIPLL